MEFGKSLRTAREAKGYTIAQIAETTRMLSAIVEGLENEDFSRIAAPIYGRGFVKLYCEAVGLDPKPFLKEFMSILNGERDDAIRERSDAARAPAAAVPQESVAPSSAASEPDLFTTADAPEMPAPQARTPESQHAQPVSRYAAPFRTKDPSALPVLPWRIIVLGGAALVLILLVVCGIRALYSATTAKPAPAARSAPAEQPAARTQMQKIPSLYID